MTRARACLVIFLLVLPAASAFASAPADGVGLSVVLDSGSGETVLAWTGGQPVFSVYRSAAPDSIAALANLLVDTPDRNWADAPAAGSGGVTIRITDSRGRLVRELPTVRATAGVNRAIWNLTWTGADPIPGAAAGGGGGRGGRGGGGGAPVAPGTYTATLSVNGQELSKDFHVRGDPEVKVSQADYEARTEAVLRSQEIQSELNRMIGTVVDSGGKILVCPPCAGVRGYEKDDLMDGVTLAGSVAMLDVVQQGAEAITF